MPKLAISSIASPSRAVRGCTRRAERSGPSLRSVRTEGAPVRAWLRGLCVAAIGLGVACGSSLAPVLNVSDAPVVVARGEVATHDVVRNGILRAVTGRGWHIVGEDADGIRAQVVSNGQSATVRIQYDERSYSIHYLDSSPGLRFDGVAIHRRYNDWVERLDRAIRTQLMSPASNDVRVVAAAGAADGGPQLEAPAAAAAADAKPSAAAPDDPVMPPAPPPLPPATTSRP